MLGAAKAKVTEDGNRETGKKSKVEADGLVSRVGDEFVIEDKAGGKIKYKKSVLVEMLVKIYDMSRKTAEAKCFGFGLDPRRSPVLRMKSCGCGNSADMKDDCHMFPKGFTFAVREKYSDFR